MTTEYERGVRDAAEWMREAGIGPMTRARMLTVLLPPASPGAGGECEKCSSLGDAPTADFGDGVCPTCDGTGANPAPAAAVADAEADVIKWALAWFTDLSDHDNTLSELGHACRNALQARALASSAQKDGAEP